MSVELECPQCRQHLSLTAPPADGRVSCPSCATVFNLPDPAPSSTPPPLPAIFCPKCGERNQENNFKCTRCGFVLHAQPQPRYVAADDSGLGGLIPYKNAQALWAYYLGIFSLIPCLGCPMGISALVLGIRALNFAKAHPEAKGKAHAWVGIIAGGLFGVANTIGIILALVAAASKK